VFVQQYKKSVKGTVSTTPVFVATHFIQRGTSAEVIATGSLFQRTLVKSNQATPGAITDPAVLHGEVAVTNIYPDQQLTAADFTRANVTIASQLSGNQRAIALPVDAAHGLVGYVQAGDYVDVMASFSGGTGVQGGIVTPLAQNVLVLATGGHGGGIGASNNNALVVRVSDRVALEAAAAADNGKVWVTLRPTSGATDSIGPNARVGSKAGK
jgi:Flp pilus assembly protein CpaB